MPLPPTPLRRIGSILFLVVAIAVWAWDIHLGSIGYSHTFTADIRYLSQMQPVVPFVGGFLAGGWIVAAQIKAAARRRGRSP